MSIVLKCEHVTVEYPLPANSADSTRSLLEFSFHSNFRRVKSSALSGKRSGKSTLLKMLAGIFPPDDGEIHMRGSVSLLSGVGVGFNGELTGRENCYCTARSWGGRRSKSIRSSMK